MRATWPGAIEWAIETSLQTPGFEGATLITSVSEAGGCCGALEAFEDASVLLTSAGTTYQSGWASTGTIAAVAFAAGPGSSPEGWIHGYLQEAAPSTLVLRDSVGSSYFQGIYATDEIRAKWLRLAESQAVSVQEVANVGTGLFDFYVGHSDYGTFTLIAGGSIVFSCGGSAVPELQIRPDAIGVLGAAPRGVYTLTGPKGGNAAVASVVDLLVSFGFAVDQTS